MRNSRVFALSCSKRDTVRTCALRRNASHAPPAPVVVLLSVMRDGRAAEAAPVAAPEAAAARPSASASPTPRRPAPRQQQGRPNGHACTHAHAGSVALPLRWVHWLITTRGCVHYTVARITGTLGCEASVVRRTHWGVAKFPRVSQIPEVGAAARLSCWASACVYQ